jgi:cell division protein FtsI/penicillin-binding protein 2
VAQRAFDAQELNALPVVSRALRQAVTTGSGRKLSDLPLAVAGKTGTAQWHTKQAPHSWFIGYAPYQDLRFGTGQGPTKSSSIALAVLVEEGGEGSGTALSIAREIFQWWATHQDKF